MSEEEREGTGGRASGDSAAEGGGSDAREAFSWTSPSTELTVRAEGEDEGGNDELVLATPPPESVEEVKTVREAVLDDVKRFFAENPTPDGLEAPTEEFIEERWFDFSYLEGLEEVERKWVNEPYAYVSLLYDADRKRYEYHVTEPVVDDLEQYVRDDLVRILRNSLMYQDLDDHRDREDVFVEEAVEAVGEHAATVDSGSVQKVIYYLLRDFLDFGKIDPLMRDGDIEDISCDGVDVPVYVYHRRYRDLRTNVTFEQDRLTSYVVRLAQRSDKHISVSDPLVDASLPDGSRIQLTLGTDVSARGSNFTIRKFSEVPLTPVDLVQWNTFSVEEMAYFWLAIENNKSLMFAGGTGSGKTSSLNAVSFFIPPDSKVVTIEDTREITLPHENWVQSVTRNPVNAGGRGEVTTYQLLQTALRQRPEYLLVGEIRTEQRVALTFFQAIGTGHTCYTTIHADSIESTLSRLQNPPLSVPAQMLQGLDIVSIQTQVMLDDDRVRRNVQVTELHASEDDPGAIATNDVYERDPRSDTYERVGESRVLEEIAHARGWSEEELEAQFDQRRRVLEYLVDNDVTGYEAVSATIHTYSRDPEYVLDRIESDDLDPESLVRREGR